MNTQMSRSRLFAKTSARLVLGLVLIDTTLFGIAGRTDWLAPWLLTLMLLGIFAVGLPWFVRHDPGLLQERLNSAGSGAPRWDRLLLGIYRVLVLVLVVTAALDAGRFKWSNMPAALQASGGVAVVAAVAVIWWCISVNHFLALHARIQGERGQTVVQAGPYQYVRHPMYTSLIVLTLGLALFLGSWLALVPAGLIGIIFVLRTLFEDQMLTTGLDGYRAYADRVQSRLFPGVW